MSTKQIKRYIQQTQQIVNKLSYHKQSIINHEHQINCKQNINDLYCLFFRDIDIKVANINHINTGINQLLSFVKQRPYKNKCFYQQDFQINHQVFNQKNQIHFQPNFYKSLSMHKIKEFFKSKNQITNHRSQEKPKNLSIHQIYKKKQNININSSRSPYCPTQRKIDRNCEDSYPQPKIPQKKRIKAEKQQKPLNPDINDINQHNVTRDKSSNIILRPNSKYIKHRRTESAQIVNNFSYNYQSIINQKKYCGKKQLYLNTPVKQKKYRQCRSPIQRLESRSKQNLNRLQISQQQHYNKIQILQQQQIDTQKQKYPQNDKIHEQISEQNNEQQFPQSQLNKPSIQISLFNSFLKLNNKQGEIISNKSNSKLQLTQELKLISICSQNHYENIQNNYHHHQFIGHIQHKEKDSQFIGRISNHQSNGKRFQNIGNKEYKSKFVQKMENYETNNKFLGNMKNNQKVQNHETYSKFLRNRKNNEKMQNYESNNKFLGNMENNEKIENNKTNNKFLGNMENNEKVQNHETNNMKNNEKIENHETNNKFLGNMKNNEKIENNKANNKFLGNVENNEKMQNHESNNKFTEKVENNEIRSKFLVKMENGKSNYKYLGNVDLQKYYSPQLQKQQIRSNGEVKQLKLHPEVIQNQDNNVIPIKEQPEQKLPLPPTFQIRIFPCNLNQQSIKSYIADKLSQVIKADLQLIQYKKLFIKDIFNENISLIKKKQKLIQVLWNRGLMINKNQLEQFISFNFNDQYLSTSISNQEINKLTQFNKYIEIFVDKYLKTQYQWEKKVLGMLTTNQIKQTKFNVTKIDLDNKGYLKLQDITCFINLFASNSPCFKNKVVKDLFLRFCRGTNNQDILSYQGFLGKIVKVDQR